MDIKQVSRLLNDINISTINTDISIEEEREQGENYYKIGKNKSKWEFLFIREVNNDFKILEKFDSESEASKYFYLHQLNNHFFQNYIQPFELGNKDINIGEPTCKIEDLKEAFTRLKIGDSYFTFNGSIKPHSIYLETINKNESKVKFIGNNGKVYIESPSMENWLAYYNTYKKVYNLYLLDKHLQRLLNNNEITKEFSSNDYKVVLS